MGRPDGVAVPERQLAGHAGGGRHGHPVVADLLDPPAARAERDDLAGPGLVDHLLVELADSPARRPGLPDHEHAEHPAVGDRPAGGDGDDARIAPAGDLAGHPVPGEARLELGELVRGIGPGEHPEDALERLAGQGLERRRPADDRVELVDRPAVEHRHRDELLGQDVERVARERRRLDRARVHPLDDDRALQEVAAVLREEDARDGAPTWWPARPTRWSPLATELGTRPG